jgi:hypothetical protein
MPIQIWQPPLLLNQLTTVIPTTPSQNRGILVVQMMICLKMRLILLNKLDSNNEVIT